MVLVQLVKGYPALTFLILVAGGLVAMWMGARAYQLRRVPSLAGADDLTIDGVMSPVLGLFALMVAFTFGQALSLESSTYSNIVSAKLAAQHLASMLVVIPAERRAPLEADVRAYTERLRAAIESNRLVEEGDALLEREAALTRTVAALDDAGKDAVSQSLTQLTAAVQQLQVNSAQRIPTTVFTLQSLYYVVCFALLGYKTAEHGSYTAARVFVGILALLFASVMFMAMNIGRPGLNSMLFDPLPK